MSFLYSILKPIVRKKVKGGAHKEETWEEYCEASYAIQKKFKFNLPKKKGYEFKEETICNCRVIIGHKAGNTTNHAIMYFVGGGARRWQMPFRKSIFRYINETDADLWIPLYPLSPDYTFIEEVDMLLATHKRMLRDYIPENIVWLGFSAGADLIMSCGRHIVHEGHKMPMPGLMIPVSCCNLYISEESKARMKEIEKRDIMLYTDMLEDFKIFYNHDGNVPRYYLGCAEEDDYTGFPKIIMYFGGDEIFAGESPEYEKAFKRCRVEDYTIKIGEGLFHGYPLFTFVKEGKKGEDEIINDICSHFNTKPNPFNRNRLFITINQSRPK